MRAAHLKSAEVRSGCHLPHTLALTSWLLCRPAIMATTQGAISKRRKFVADGVFYAELNEFFQRELAEEGYSGVEVRVTPTVTDISTPSTSHPLQLLACHLLTLTPPSSSHPRNPHARSPRRARATDPRAHVPDPEALQVPREQRVPLRGQGAEQRSLRSRPVRVPALQAAQWPRGAESVLRCAAVHHGERCEGL